MGKKKLLLLIPVILIIAAVYMYFTVFNPPVVVAELIINEGTAEYLSNGNWETASSGQLLTQGDSVRTLQGATATIIFFESSILRLDENTEITLSELDPTGGDSKITIEQEAGKTWTKILQLSGISEYNIESPTTVATVRGTGFGFYVSDDGTNILLESGNLSLKTYISEAGVKRIIQNANLQAGEMVRINRSQVETQVIQKMQMVRDAFINRNMQFDEEHILIVREKLIKRLEPVMDVVMDRYGFTKEEMDTGVDGYLRGEHRLPKFLEDILERRASIIDLPGLIDQADVAIEQTLGSQVEQSTESSGTPGITESVAPTTQQTVEPADNQTEPVENQTEPAREPERTDGTTDSTGISSGSEPSNDGPGSLMGV